MIHVIDGWLVSANIKLNGSRFILDEIIIQPLIRWAVPIFIMISGYLLLDPKKDITIKKIIKYINRMILILLTFGFFYCILENLFTYGIVNL
jgi:surface polysaccharide O-acyltransferase-like enzyme